MSADAEIRNLIAAYCHALDDGDTDAVVATFAPDGTVVMPMGTHSGADALRAAYDGWKPRGPQRHVVTNTHITVVDAAHATARSDLQFLTQRDGTWVTQIVGRYDDELVHDGDRWLFARRSALFS